MTEQTKRGPGRPRTGRGREAVTLTLTREVAEFLNALPAGERSKFVDDWLREHPEIKEKLHGS